MMRVVIIILSVFFLTGCRLKEKVTADRSFQTDVRTMADSMVTNMTLCLDTQAEENGMLEIRTADSIVEKYYEHIVTDSTGRRLLHESSRTKERYKSLGQNQAATHTVKWAADKSEDCQSKESNSNKSYSLDESKKKEVRNRNHDGFLWLVGLMVLLFAGVIVYEYKK